MVCRIREQGVWRRKRVLGLVVRKQGGYLREGFPSDESECGEERYCRTSEDAWPRRSAQRSSTPKADPACTSPAQTPGLRYVAATENAGPTTGHTQTSVMSENRGRCEEAFRRGGYRKRARRRRGLRPAYGTEDA